MNTTAAFAVQDPSQVAAPRRAVQILAERLDFSETRAGKAALMVSELATNLAKHARGGEILLRALRLEGEDGEPPGIEVIALDSGPGMRDVEVSRQDGVSTSGTLGQGLGAIERQADFFQIYSVPTGTVAVARIWRLEPRRGAPLPLYDVGGVQVSMTGEDVCGDDWTWRARPGRLAMIVADGLGHGLAAHDAARAATRTFERIVEEAPQRILTDVHNALRATRGAAVAVIAVDMDRGVARYSGLGNISSVILLPTGTRQSLVSYNGIAGAGAPRMSEFSYPVPRDAILVMHSDGLGTHWDLSTYPGLKNQHPSIIAGVLYRDHSRRRDDVTVAVARERRP